MAYIDQTHSDCKVTYTKWGKNVYNDWAKMLVEIIFVLNQNNIIENQLHNNCGNKNFFQLKHILTDQKL